MTRSCPGAPYEPSGSPILGTSANPQLTFVDGNATMSGNVSGTGILVVTGDLRWNGTPEWNGLILTLGDEITLAGSGRGGLKTFGGSLVALNLRDPDDPSCPADAHCFGPFEFDFRGGGRGEYNYNCHILQHLAVLTGLQPDPPAFDATNQRYADQEWTPSPNTWWPRCDIKAPGDDEVTEAIIASWRENLGWRPSVFLAP